MAQSSRKSFQDGPFWRPGIPRVGGAKAVPFVHKLNPRVFCVFARNRNDNLVVFEGKLNGKKEFVGVEHYWLLLEPSYMEGNRKKGLKHDREETIVFDDLAYGFDQTVVQAKKKYRVVMKQLKERPLIVVLEPNGHINAYVKMKKKLCRLLYVWIQDDKQLWAKVSYIDLFGQDVRTNKNIQERIYR